MTVRPIDKASCKPLCSSKKGGLCKKISNISEIASEKILFIFPLATKKCFQCFISDFLNRKVRQDLNHMIIKLKMLRFL